MHFLLWVQVQPFYIVSCIWLPWICQTLCKAQVVFDCIASVSWLLEKGDITIVRKILPSVIRICRIGKGVVEIRSLGRTTVYKGVIHISILAGSQVLFWISGFGMQGSMSPPAEVTEMPSTGTACSWQVTIRRDNWPLKSQDSVEHPV